MILQRKKKNLHAFLLFKGNPSTALHVATYISLHEQTVTLLLVISTDSRASWEGSLWDACGWRLGYYRKTHLNYGGAVPYLGSSTVKTEKVNRERKVFLPLYFLSVDATWPVASSSCHLDAPITTDGILNCEPKWPLSPLRYFHQRILSQQQERRQRPQQQLFDWC